MDIETDFNFTGTFEWKVKPSEKFKGVQYGEQTEFEVRFQYHPSESFFTSFEVEKGDAIAYRIDTPEIGNSIEGFTSNRNSLLLKLSVRFTSSAVAPLKIESSKSIFPPTYNLL